MTDEKINRDMIIGAVMEKHPATIAVFRKHFKTGGCFTCPGANREDIAFGAMMHNANIDRLIEELNEAVSQEEAAEKAGQ